MEHPHYPAKSGIREYARTGNTDTITDRKQIEVDRATEALASAIAWRPCSSLTDTGQSTPNNHTLPNGRF